MIDVLNCGAGVQSTAILLAVRDGVLPPLDHAIFADTGWEPKDIYDHLPGLERLCQDMGTQWHVVTIGRSILDDSMVAKLPSQDRKPGERWASMPLFIQNADGTRGMIRRQCTYEYKIRPIDRKLRELIGLKPRQRAPKTPTVRQWYGISFDERRRMKLPDHDWVENFYPLVEDRHSRSWCENYITDAGWTAVKSACIGCPFHDDGAWRRMKLERPDEFAEACRVDDQIRVAPDRRGAAFLHSSLIPLREVDFRNDFDKGQLPLFEECSGTCWT